MENEVEEKVPFTLTIKSVRRLVSDWRQERSTEHLTEKNNERWNNPVEHEGYTFGYADGYGGEGCGDEYWCVFYAEKDGVKKYYYIPGWYSSGNGGEREWSSLYEVEPYEKTVRDWKQVK